MEFAQGAHAARLDRPYSKEKRGEAGEPLAERRELRRNERRSPNECRPPDERPESRDEAATALTAAATADIAREAEPIRDRAAPLPSQVMPGCPARWPRLGLDAGSFSLQVPLAAAALDREPMPKELRWRLSPSVMGGGLPL